MTKECIDLKMEEKFHSMEIEQLVFISTLVGIMEKHGYPLNFMRQEKHLSYPEPHVLRKSYHLSFAVVTPDNPISSSIYLEVAKLHQNYTKVLKNLRTDWYSIIDIQEDAGTLEVSISLCSQTYH